MKRDNQQKSTGSVLLEVASSSELIQIFPAGITIGYDGRGPYNLLNPESVIAESTKRSVDLVIDREHAYDLLPPGTPIKAAGWIKNLVVKDGAIWAMPEWTPTAQKELADKEYRYISPTFNYDPNTREVTRLIGATLTNRPNFDMKAVASEISTPTKETPQMNKLLLALASALGLAATSTEDEILTNAAAKVDELTALQKAMASVKAALKVDDKADADVIIATASALMTGKQSEPDPSKFVPMSVHTATASQLAALQKETASEKASAAVEAAIKAGKVTPAQKEWAIGYASQNLEEFKKYADAAPVIASAQPEATSGTPAGTGSLSAEDIAFCSSIGLSQEDFKKQMAAEKAAA